MKAEAGRRAGAAPTPNAADPPPPLAAAWRETGRAERGDALWITWMAVLGHGGDVLYRSLVVADGAIAVSIELEPQPGGGTARSVHRSRCGLPPPDDTRGVEGRIALLLAAADKAVARAVGAGRPGNDERAPFRPAARGLAAGTEQRSAGPVRGAEAGGAPKILTARSREAQP